jgi:hypothetical protein
MVLAVLALPPRIFGSIGGANSSALHNHDTVACRQSLLLVAALGASNSSQTSQVKVQSCSI